jgi:hypothetical protein
MIEHGDSVNTVSANSEALSRQGHMTSILRSGRPRPPPNSNGGGTTQTVTTMGRTIHSSRSHSAWIISSHSNGRHEIWELMEHRTSQEVLPLAISQKLLGRQCIM